MSHDSGEARPSEPPGAPSPFTLADHGRTAAVGSPRPVGGKAGVRQGLVLVPRGQGSGESEGEGERA